MHFFERTGHRVGKACRKRNGRYETGSAQGLVVGGGAAVLPLPDQVKKHSRDVSGEVQKE